MRLDDPEGELFAFHWHPDVFAASFPHVHVRGHPQHLPTGRVFLEDVLALSVEIGTEPRNDGWREVLAGNHRDLAQSQTWGQRPEA
jgi:hypothetical protein